MFSEISRYNGLQDVVAPDVKGRMLKSRSLRLTPVVEGEVLHNLEDKDRLDHLGSTYYKEPGKWWRFCDANAAFLSPCAMLGAEPVVTTTFSVTYSNGDPSVVPPWYKVMRTLQNLPEVLTVLFEQKIELVTQTVQYSGRTLDVHTDRYSPYLKVTYNRLSLTPEDICAAIVETDPLFRVEDYRSSGRVGKNIVIPPDIVE